MRKFLRHKLFIFPLIALVFVYIIFNIFIVAFLSSSIVFLIIYYWQFIKNYFTGIFISTIAFFGIILLFSISIFALFKYHNNGEIARNVNVFDILNSIIRDVF